MNEPKLRFKADDGSQFPDWEEKKLGDITSQYKVRNKKRLPLEIYSVNNIVGFIPQSEQFDDAGYLKDTDTSIYMIVPPKHFAYNPARLDIGSIGYQYLDHDVQVSSLYEVFETSNLVNDEFLWSWFHTHYFNNVVKRLQEGGVRLYFYYDKMQEVKIGLPSLPEQQKIAEFLSTIDTVIEKQKETVSAWEERKKGVMQKLFSQEVRFKADDGSEFPEWEKKKLEDVVEFLDGQRKPLEAGQRVSGKYPYYGASGIIDYVENYIFDEELILLSEDGANILDRNYRVCFLAKGKYWVNNHAHVLRAMDGNVNGFICEQLELFDYRKYNSGGAQPKLNQATCRSIIMNIPCLAEQQKIADCLSSLDEVIEKQKATLAAWEALKKGLLQQMFV